MDKFSVYDKEADLIRDVDYNTPAGCAALAADIQTYWRRRGYEVKVWIEPVELPRYRYQNREGWAVRTNLGPGGLPHESSKIA